MSHLSNDADSYADSDSNSYAYSYSYSYRDCHCNRDCYCYRYRDRDRYCDTYPAPRPDTKDWSVTEASSKSVTALLACSRHTEKNDYLNLRRAYPNRRIHHNVKDMA